ncbi:ABC transporter permease [Solemya velum gill symbiont]|uniref:ABC-type spermidine/putrescine transporter AfuCBA, subunit B n=1 Tax=Solemya velum gill symbiont TaxID=2340 RepID=A0A0B0HD82_SOVGS|nr:iron ABC transporter permease [Solemya velum gill symbiont]KHF26572.1 ABC-type spermidine/putrescine transporter AfuCBA, subunit B [Solemya velum gill symbiont]OOY52627.1 iron ABC transporter permease [Solemya velum gill symbiont]OOY65853.1 iron ABC transporter permease [Solemya velum gill symbiont]OOY67752.1 iron ABC transporter permease [Solemya velum gill symbiont]OOY70345.1 iron ABC transporter permease [Solemya velum gill symbiont]
MPTLSIPSNLYWFPRSLINLWNLGIIGIAFLMALPVLVIASFVFLPASENWQHLVDNLLAEYVSNSLLLMVGVSVGVLSIGVITAWLTSMCEFPGRRWLTWALLLPLAIPAYIIAYTYTGLLDFEGPVQGAMRAWFDWSYGDYWFPEVRSLGGAMVMLSLVLYPYVYMLTRAAFLEQSICVLEVSRTLGNTPFRSFTRVALPLARPAIVTGLSLALMETLADYGTVQYFGVSTFTTGIFRTWFGLGDSATAAQLSATLLGFVFLLVIMERWSRKRARFHHTSNRYSEIRRYQLHGKRAWLAFIACLSPVLFGFIIPAGQLLYWAINTATETINWSFALLAWNSVMLAGISAVVAVLLALLLAYGKRLQGNLLSNTGVRIASMGYAVPGTVIAVGVLLPFAWLDNSIDAWMREQFNISTGLLLSGTLFALVFAYTVRFLSVSIQAIESGLGKIKFSMDDAGRSLGLSPTGVLARIHLPLMKGTVVTALLLVFVDVLKELPATLILRPFNFNTLAVRAYEMASDERLADAGAPALMIVAAGIIPVIMLSRIISRSRAGGVQE